MAESLVTGEGGSEAPEADVHVFNGRAMLVRILTGRKLTSERRDAWFDREGRQLHFPAIKVRTERYDLAPDRCRELAELAEAVATGFSFIRVDVYLSADGVKLGELSPYPWGGAPAWGDAALDAKMGALFAPGADTTQFEDYRDDDQRG